MQFSICGLQGLLDVRNAQGRYVTLFGEVAGLVECRVGPAANSARLVGQMLYAASQVVNPVGKPTNLSGNSLEASVHNRNYLLKLAVGLLKLTVGLLRPLVSTAHVIAHRSHKF